MNAKHIVSISAILTLSLSTNLLAETNTDIEVKVTSMKNVARSTAIEVCGTAVHKDGVQPLMVTIQHSESQYSTLSGKNSNWCALVARKTFTGDVDVSAMTLDGKSSGEGLKASLSRN